MIEEHRELVRQLFPDLVVDTFEPTGDGWASFTYRLNGERIVQIPRTAYAAEALRKQIGVLPELTREVSARVPFPELSSLGDPPVMIYERIEGRPCDSVHDGIWPERLGRFLYDLHSVPPEFVGLRAVGPEDVRVAKRSECARLADLVVPRLEEPAARRATSMLSAYLGDDSLWSFAPVLTHRDLGPEHVLVDEVSGDLAGVIDWEEVGIDDPAMDFAWWLDEMPRPGERALAAYGGAPDLRFRERARVIYALMPWHEVEYGLETGQEAFVRSGLEGVVARLP
jgi:aminoglycoside phosphotransferase (APT) family kinase protein